MTRQTGFLLIGWVVLKGDLSDIVFLSLFLFLFLTKGERERERERERSLLLRRLHSALWVCCTGSCVWSRVGFESASLLRALTHLVSAIWYSNPGRGNC